MSQVNWRVDIEGLQHVIEFHHDTFLGIIESGGGHLAVDGNVIKTWGSSMNGIPDHIMFEVKDKKAEIRRKGLIWQNPVLYFDGKEIKHL
jgi:hypothetical protein